jgi:hypothetical protein
MRARKLFSPPLVLFVAALSIYSVTFSFELLATWDDKLYLIKNETIKAVTPAHIKEAFTNYYVGNYAPLHILSYMLDHFLWGLKAVGYHAENVLFHAFNGVLFYLFLRRIDMSEWNAAIAAWIFLFHPVQVETVAWVSQRKNLLAMFFFLFALIAYQEYCRRDSRRILPYMLALLCASASLLCKSVAVIFPAVALLYDHTIIGGKNRSFKLRLYDKLPFLVIAGIAACLALVSQSPEYGGGRRDFFGGSRLATFYTVVPIVVDYIKDCLWPSDLIAFYYTIDVKLEPDIHFISAMFVLATIAIICIRMNRRACSLVFWIGLFFIALLPVLQIVPIITLKNDRYLYFPMLGFAVLMVEGARFISLKLPATYSLIMKYCLGTILLLLPVLAYQQTLHWRNDISLWTRVVLVEPENRLGWRLLSMGYTMRGDSANAVKAFNRYMELFNKKGTIHYFEEK